MSWCHNPSRPEKWQAGLASFLDAFGPFEIWALTVVIIGASTLAGAPRKPVAWVIIGLFLALRILLAITGALFSPGVEAATRARAEA